MMFTIGCIMMMLGFSVGHILGDPHRYTYNKFDYLASVMFVSGILFVLSSIFTVTWRYMP